MEELPDQMLSPLTWMKNFLNKYIFNYILAKPKNIPYIVLIVLMAQYYSSRYLVTQ